MARIEELTEKLEDPKTGVEQSLGLYEEAMKAVGEAQQRLTEIEHRFEEIQKRAVTEDLEAPDRSNVGEDLDEGEGTQHTLL